VEALLAMRPDLVLLWASGAEGALGARLRAAGVPTFALRTEDTADVFRASTALGALSGRGAAAAALNARLRAGLDSVRSEVGSGSPARPSVLFVVWPDPPRTAGPETFVAQVIGAAGGRSAFPELTQDWPQLSMEEVVRRQPDVVLLPVGEDGGASAAGLAARPGWRELRAVREGRVARVEADLVNRPGPNIVRAARAVRDSLRAVLERRPL
jgi:iron complex transport system substrate-binding protein